MRLQHNEQLIDSKVLEAIESREIWKGSRGTTAMGYFIVRRSELEKHLNLPQREIVSSLNRLELAGKICNHGDTIDKPDDTQYYRLPQ
jgi:hypothetical protein